jgi:hypothetical protein
LEIAILELEEEVHEADMAGPQVSGRNVQEWSPDQIAETEDDRSNTRP